MGSGPVAMDKIPTYRPLPIASRLLPATSYSTWSPPYLRQCFLDMIQDIVILLLPQDFEQERDHLRAEGGEGRCGFCADDGVLQRRRERRNRGLISNLPEGFHGRSHRQHLLIPSVATSVNGPAVGGLVESGHDSDQRRDCSPVTDFAQGFYGKGTHPNLVHGCEEELNRSRILDLA